MSSQANERAPLTSEELGPDPLDAYRRWMEVADERTGLNYVNAATLSTVDPEGRPDGRIVLVKGTDSRGVLFFTNYRSTKGRDLAANPHAAITSYWDPLARQVRIRGPVERLTAEQSDEYFGTRPRGSQLGAWASEQSSPIGSRADIEERFRDVQDRFRDRPVPRPEHWGGFRLEAREIEFWQDGADRLHDRFLYLRGGEGWVIRRLSP
ncbi:MAG: pyridoxamine 5'-phosphate oxidase [Gemmatimonadota bacterium]